MTDCSVKEADSRLTFPRNEHPQDISGREHAVEEAGRTEKWGVALWGGELRDSLHSCFSRIVTSREGKQRSLLILQTLNPVLILENKDSDVSSVLVGF